jgi:hypothetical protein
MHVTETCGVCRPRNCPSSSTPGTSCTAVSTRPTLSLVSSLMS